MRVLSNVTPTPEQLMILTDTGAGFRLIRGAAGSGKTTTAAMRLRQLCAARIARKRRLSLPGSIRVMVLTFNRSRTSLPAIPSLFFIRLEAVGSTIHVRF